MQPSLNELLAKRRDRAIATVLGVKERECDAFLPPESRARLRKVILDQINEVADLALDVIKSLDTGEVVLNEAYLERLDAIYAAVVTNGR